MRKFLRVFSIIVILAAIPVGIYLVGKATGFFGKASGTPANLVVDLSISSPSNYSWKNLSQGGEEKGRMFQNVVSEVAALHPTYIRIDHVFDMYDVVSKNLSAQAGGNNIAFDWTKLDQTINDITSTGAKPFISLSYMPPAISKSGAPEDLPANWSDWEFVVQKMIEHVSGTLGISNVYYEVWNEPDLFGNFKTYGPKNYFDLYSHTVAGANSANKVKPFKIGGPATTQLYETWSKNFAKFILANHLRLNFYSWHKYSTNLDNLANNAINARAWLAESGLPNNLELIISEIGPDSNNSPVYDTNEGAIHAIASAATLEDTINKIFTFEVKDGPVNKWGILNQDGIAKPRYNALLFLNKMAGASLHVLGQGSWVKAFAKNDGKTTRTLIVSYDPDNTHTESVPITFTNLKSQNFEFKRTDFNGGVVKDIPVSTTSSSWSTLELLNPNTAGILEITPK